jgi:hypothetical protein
MDSAAARVEIPGPVAFCDGFGERRLLAGPAGRDACEILCLDAALASVPSFEAHLRERTSRLAGFRHAGFGYVRTVDRLSEPDTLAVASDATPGLRLAGILSAAEREDLQLDLHAALHLIGQLLPAMAALHQHDREAIHGALAPERLVVTPRARLVVVEYVFGAALEQLHYSHPRYWKDLRVALPRSAGLPRFDERIDVLQIGLVALSLILSRPLREEDYPARVPELAASAWAISSRGDLEPLPSALRAWLARALQIDLRQAFASVADAATEFERTLAADKRLRADRTALEAFLARHHAGVENREAAAPPAASAAPAVVPSVPAAAPVAPAAPVEHAPRAAPVVPTTILAHPLSARPDEPGEDEITAAEGEPTATGEEDEEELVPATWWLKVAVAALALLALTGGGMYAARRYSLPPGGPLSGTLVVTTNPAGAEVAIDGERRGVTPVTLTLPAGDHMLELTGLGAPRRIPVTILAGAQVSQRIEFAGAPAGSMPEAGVDPVATGEAADSVVDDDQVPVEGWLAVSSPVEVKLFENGRLLGTSEGEHLVLGAGRHDVDVINEPLAYHESRSIDVLPGRVSSLAVQPPPGLIALNAIPWAEVWIDGERIGETPIGNHSIAIGSHEVVFRHPELGERVQSVTVTLTTPVRVSVDLRQP